MTPFMAEVVGTALLITLGNGVVANVVLNKTLGNKSGWIVISFGWAIAVYVGVIFAGPVSGAHLNPAVTVAMAVAGKFNWSDVPMYVAAQLLGACIGSFLMWLSYKKHFDATESDHLGIFCTGATIPDPFYNCLTEVIASFVFMMAVFAIVKPQSGIGSLDALPVSLIVLGIGLCLGGPTGYAINPARDLGPRCMHAILPIKGKGSSNWGYAWVPIVGPLVGATMAALVVMAF